MNKMSSRSTIAAMPSVKQFFTDFGLAFLLLVAFFVMPAVTDSRASVDRPAAQMAVYVAMLSTHATQPIAGGLAFNKSDGRSQSLVASGGAASSLPKSQSGAAQAGIAQDQGPTTKLLLSLAFAAVAAANLTLARHFGSLLLNKR